MPSNRIFIFIQFFPSNCFNIIRQSIQGAEKRSDIKSFGNQFRNTMKNIYDKTPYPCVPCPLGEGGPLPGAGKVHVVRQGFSTIFLPSSIRRRRAALAWVVANFRGVFQLVRWPIDQVLGGIEGLLMAIPPFVIIAIFWLISCQHEGKRRHGLSPGPDKSYDHQRDDD